MHTKSVRLLRLAKVYQKYLLKHKHTHTHIYIYIYICVCVCVCVCVYLSNLITIKLLKYHIKYLGESKFLQYFSHVQVCNPYIMWLKQFKSLKLPTGVDSIVMVSGLTRSALLHSVVSDLKAAQMNVQHSLIREHLFYEFELSHNAEEATKNICFAKRWKHSWSKFNK